LNNSVKIFDYGVEGGGETLFRITLPDGSMKIVADGSAMAWDENDNDIIKKWKKEYSSWEEFWQQFISEKSWFRFYPVFIHEDCRGSILEALNKLDAETGKEHYIQNWESALKGDTHF
jgi:hypothetical protein